ncbi:MAG: nucleotide exchange factor GrpE [Bdellovibrionia bacterium]
MSEDKKNGHETDGDEEFEIEEVVDASARGDGSDETERLRQELEKAKSDILYVRADFDNYRKRAMKERTDYLKYAGEQAFVGVLEVLDNFERALGFEVNAENLESFKKGVSLIADSLKNTLKKFGVSEVPSEGVTFDPNLHEAISSEETDEVPSGNISKVFRKTYKLHDRVIRPGQVVVARPKTEQKE